MKTDNLTAITTDEEVGAAYERLNTLEGTEYLSDSEHEELDNIRYQIQKYERSIGFGTHLEENSFEEDK